MNEKLDRIIEELSKLKTAQAVANAHLEFYNKQLKEHIKRTELLEKEMHTLWKWKWTVAGGVTVAAIVGQYLLKLVGL